LTAVSGESRRRLRERRLIVVAAIAVALVVLSIGALLASQILNPPPQPTIVIISGTVYQGCVGAEPLSVTFMDANGRSFTAVVHSQNYSISLADGRTYSVTVIFLPVVPNATPQTASESPLVLATDSRTYTYDIRPC
jgi:hypothetical protein